MRVWGPRNRWSAQELIGNGTIQLNQTQKGDYLVEIRGMRANTRYQLSSNRGASASRVTNSNVTWVSATQPYFTEPVMDIAAETVSAVKLADTSALPEQMLVWPLALMLLIGLSGWILHRKPLC